MRGISAIQSLVIGIAAATCCAIGIQFAWGPWSAETERATLQEVVSQNQWLEGRLRGEIDYWAHTLRASVPVLSERPGDGKFSGEPDLVEVSYWARSRPAAAATRKVRSFNIRSPVGERQFVRADQYSDAIQRALIEPAFRGRMVALGTWTIDPQGLLLMAVPVNQGSVPTVVSAHIRLGRFQKLLESPPHGAATRSFVLDEAGNRILGPQLTDHKDLLKQIRNPRTTASTSRVMGLVSAQDASGARFVATSSQIAAGLSLLTLLPEGEIKNRISDVKWGLATRLALVFFSVTSLAFAVLTIRSRLQTRPNRHGLDVATAPEPIPDDKTDPQLMLPPQHVASAETTPETPSSIPVADPAEVPAEPEPASKPNSEYLVDNGSRILGPMSPGEIARMLFTQEIDFDARCWMAPDGAPTTIRDAGIFSGSTDVEESHQAVHWVYDGETIHGPVTLGFVRTAIQHGALRKDQIWLCEESTLEGWKPYAATASRAA